MSTNHTLNFISETQYSLTVSGGFNIILSQVSPTGDSFYDMGSALMITTDYIGGVINGDMRQNLFSYTLDGTTTNVTRADTGTFSSPVIIFESSRKLTFNSVTQYLISFRFMDNSGIEEIVPSSFQIEVNDFGIIDIPQFKTWLDNGTRFQIHAIIWKGTNVNPANQGIYVANAPLNETIRGRVFQAKLLVTDYFGIPIANAQVFVTFANGTVIQSPSGPDGVVSLGLIPTEAFNATISYIGTATTVNGDASLQSTITGRVFASYPTFGLIAGGVIISVFGSMIVHWRRRLPSLLGRIMGGRIMWYIRVNWGAPFVVGFMLLLLVAAVSLSIGLPSLADSVAVYAFYALVVGVALQLACFLKYNKRSAETN
ncbi:hypothetical protein A3K80_04380 [Candidatus Bathyarchaeota archaeon RBG_13_38_9]|nr:MAG: hypothetical protein A3K80_04380 [Candidatus Bathyarchaeota archaeon RBG_13_38_9]